MKNKKLLTISPEEISELTELHKNLNTMPSKEAEYAVLRIRSMLEQRSFSEQGDLYESLMMRLGEYYGRKGEKELSIEILSELLEYAQKHNLKDLMLHVKSNIAINKAMCGQYWEALDVWKESLNETQDPKRKINLLNNICMAYGNLEDFNTAIKYGYRGLDLAIQNDLEEMKISPYINLGSSYMYMEDYPKALKNLQAALALAEKYRVNRSLPDVKNNISLIYNALKETDKALEYAFDSLETLESEYPEANKGNPQNNIGFIYETAGHLAEALKYYHIAEESYKKTSASPALANTILNQASIHEKLGNYDLALAKIKEAEIVIKDMNAPLVALRIPKLYSKIYAEIHDFEKAFIHQSKFREVLEQRLEYQIKNSISKNEAEYYLKKIEDQAQSYKKQNSELKSKNKIIRQTTKELKESNRNLSDSIQALNWIVSVITHDVRAPLSNFGRVLGMMLSGDIDSSEHQEILQSLKRSSDNIYKLIDEILDGIRLQRRKLDEKTELQIQNVVPILQSIVSIYKPIAKQKQITLTCRYDSEKVMAKVDSDLLKIVMRNLLNNATKFTPEKGEVTLRVIPKKDWVELILSDTGIGIDKQTLKDLRKPRNQGSARKLHKDAGIGLGFSLCRDSIRKMNAQFEIDSIPKEGTTIKILLPVV